MPKGLSVLWVVTTGISLLGTVVEEWDSSGSQSESESVLEHSLIVVLVKEPGVIMVVNEETEGIDILEVTSFFVESVFNSVHRLLGAENIPDCVIHWVVEQSGNWSLVWTDIARISIEHFSHLEDSGSWTKFGPEVFWNLWNGIYSNTIKVVGADKVSNPVLELLSDPLVFLVKIWEVSKSAVLNLLLVTPILDITLIVIMISRIEWLDRTEVHTNWGNVIGNHINHNKDTFVMSSLNHVLKILVGSEVIIGSSPVSSPVPVVTWLLVIDDWRDPDSIESHTGDIVKVFNHSFVSSSAVIGEVTAGTGTIIVLGESISQDLINSSLLPLVNLGSGGSSKECSRGESNFTQHIKVLINNECVYLFL